MLIKLDNTLIVDIESIDRIQRTPDGRVRVTFFPSKNSLTGEIAQTVDHVIKDPDGRHWQTICDQVHDERVFITGEPINLEKVGGHG